MAFPHAAFSRLITLVSIMKWHASPSLTMLLLWLLMVLWRQRLLLILL